MSVKRTNREQYRWALWAALVAAVGLAIAGYGCGADGRTDSGDDRATDTREVAPPTADARTEGTDMDAAHSAAWMEALDGLETGLVTVEAVGVTNADLPAVEKLVTSPTEAPYVAPTPYAVLDTSVQLTEAQMVDLLRQAGFDEYTWPFMLRIAWCESRFSPNATGAAGEVGLFQIHPRWHPDAVYDPLGNVKAAYRISAGGYDYSAWSCRP